jgi:hypothetical protein
MTLPRLRSLVAFPVLFALAACGSSTPEAARPAPDGAVSPPVASLPATSATPAPAPAPDLVVSQDACQSDADCAPAACCHASACMSKDKVKPCNMMCTQVCQPGTIDCGGGCLCHQGHCAAKVMSTVK